MRVFLAALACTLGELMFAVPVLVALGGGNLSSVPSVPDLLASLLPTVILLIAGSTAIVGAWRARPVLVWPAAAIYAGAWLFSGLGSWFLLLLPAVLFGAAWLLLVVPRGRDGSAVPLDPGPPRPH